MLLSERLLQANREINRQEAKKIQIQQDQDDDEMGYAYSDRPPGLFLNQEKGVFAADDDHSLNKAPSIFDRTAIFRTGGEG